MKKWCCTLQVEIKSRPPPPGGMNSEKIERNITELTETGSYEEILTAALFVPPIGTIPVTITEPSFWNTSVTVAR